MAKKTSAQKNARMLQKLYNTNAHGTNYSCVLKLVQEKGLDGAITQLEQWGMKPWVLET